MWIIPPGPLSTVKYFANAGVETGAVCECACGTGGLTLPLAKTYDMTGVDSSGDMLAVAADKARRAGLNIPFVQIRYAHLHPAPSRGRRFVHL